MLGPGFTNISKRERLQITRERAKLEKNLGSIADLSRLPAAIFVVDISKEHIAIAEARKLNIPTFAIVDTNSDPTIVDFPIPANDDASKSISLIIGKMVEAIEEGLMERKVDRDKREEGDREDGTSGSKSFDMDDDDEDVSPTGERLRGKPAPAEEGGEGRGRRPVARKPLGKRPTGPPRK
jgi:small subunit ribosomal protein S2